MEIVHWICWRELEGSIETGLKLLTETRRARLGRYLKLEDRLRCLAAGLMLRRLLNVRQDQDLAYGPYGKPALANGASAFSLSHGGDYVAISVGVAGRGLDVEPRPEAVEPALARACLTSAEYAFFQQSPDPSGYFGRLWVGKESLMKATGLGLNLPPASLTCPTEDEPGLVLQGIRWSVAWAELPGHFLALARAGDRPRIVLKPLSRQELLEE